MHRILAPHRFLQAAFLTLMLSPAFALAADGEVAGAAATTATGDSASVEIEGGLSPDQVADLNRAEAYLNTLSTMKARFVQVSSDGGFAEGDLVISRPGKLRFEYDPPVPILMIADGITLLYYDRELEQASFLPLWETPLWFLIGKEVAFSGDIEVVQVERGPGTLTIVVRDEDKPDLGTVTLIFSDQPMALHKWIVHDAQGVTTQVSLIDPAFDVAVDSEAFSYDDLEFNRAARPSNR